MDKNEVGFELDHIVAKNCFMPLLAGNQLCVVFSGGVRKIYENSKTHILPKRASLNLRIRSQRMVVIDH